MRTGRDCGWYSEERMDTVTESFIRNGIFSTTVIASLCNSLLIKAFFDSFSLSVVPCFGQWCFFFLYFEQREREGRKKKARENGNWNENSLLMCSAICHSSPKTAEVWKMLTVWKMFSYLLTKKSLWCMFCQQVGFWYKKGHTELRYFYSEVLQWSFIARARQQLSFTQPTYWNYSDDHMSSFPQWNPCPWSRSRGCTAGISEPQRKMQAPYNREKNIGKKKLSESISLDLQKRQTFQPVNYQFFRL